MSEKKKVIIIGGGVAGLSAGIYAQLNGFKSQIIEMHSIAGGLCTAWYRKNYRFDYSIQWLVGTSYGTFHDTFWETNILNKDVKVLNAEIHNRNLSSDGSDMIVYTNLPRWEKYLCEKAPEDKASISKLCRDIRRCCYLKPFDLAPALRNPFHYIKALFTSFPTLYTVMRLKNLTFSEYIRSLKFKNKNLEEKLINIYGDCDFSAVAFLLIMSWYTKKNAGYPIGGSLGVANRMHERYVEYGGEMLFKKQVTEIITENGKATGVRLKDGSVINSDYVISAADGYTTIFKLLKGSFLSPKIKNTYDNWAPFTSFVQVSFGINANLQTDFPIQLIIAKGKKIGSTTIEHNFRILNYNFDHTMAPENKTCIVIRFDSPFNFWKDISKEDYKKEKQLIEEDAIKILEESFPGSSAHIEVCDVATPLTTVRYTGAWCGSYEGFRPTPRNIIKQMNLVLPKLDHFYIAGQWLFPGGGIPPSVQSGKWAIQMICKKEKQCFKSKCK